MHNLSTLVLLGTGRHTKSAKISTFKPMGKTAANILTMIPATPDPLRQAALTTEIALAGARGTLAAGLKPVHGICTDFLAQGRGMFRGNVSVQRQLDMIVTQDQTPHEIFTRAGQTQALEARN